MLQEIEITIPAFPHLRECVQTILLPKASVVLGLNGSGKSRLLKEIEHQASLKQIPVFRISGNRFDRVPYATSISASHVELYRENLIEEFEKQYQNKDNGTRIERAFRLLAARDYIAHKNYADAVLGWYEGTREASKEPQKPVSEIERLLSSVSQLLPHIEFVNQKEGYIQARYKKQNPYHVNDVCDGEREVICNFIDVWVGTPSRGLLLVDEPELHLHPSLANNFWGLVEKQFPNTNFLYATHSISFALRPDVRKLFHIGKSGQLIILPSNSALSSQEKADFLGAIPGVLHSSRLLFCEGSGQEVFREGEEIKSIDFLFYSWLLKSDNVKIHPMGPSSAVLQSMKSAEILRQLSDDIAVAGVIDRDDYPDKAIESMANTVEVLSYYEVESYLCVPDLLIKIAKSKGIELDYRDLTDSLVNYAEAQIPLVASRRFTHRAKKEPDHQYGIMEEEKKTLQKAVDSRNIQEILRYFHGKELANKLASTVGCKDTKELLSSAIAAVAPEEIHEFMLLRRRILDRLRAGPSTKDL